MNQLLYLSFLAKKNVRLYTFFILKCMPCLVIGAAPSISEFSPLSGPANTFVSISGSNFSTTLANNNVTFGGLRGTVLSATTTTLTVKVPLGASHNKIMVQVGGLIAMSNRAFTVTSPCAGRTLNKKDNGLQLNGGNFISSDFNADGNLDVAVSTGTSYDVTQVVVAMGDGKGSFGNAISYATGLHLNEISTADFDGDGDMDIVVLHHVGSLDLLVNSGYGTFILKTNICPETGIYGFTVGDYDKDGKQDIAFITNKVLTVYVGLGGTNQSFSKKLALATNYYTEINSGDFDGNGTIDLVFGCGDYPGIDVFLGKGDGSFAFLSRHASSSYSRYITVGDFDANGKQDVAIACLGNNKVSVHQSTGNITNLFAARVDISTNFPYETHVADLNGDGKLDLAVPNYDGSAVSTFLGNGLGNFTANNIYSGLGSKAFALSIGDFDKDGRNDIMVGTEANSYQSFLSNYKPPFITSFTPLSGSPGSSVTIQGANFSPNVGGNLVTFDGLKATVTMAAANSLTVTVPVGASFNVISVEVDCYVANSSRPFDVTKCLSGSFAPAEQLGYSIKPNYVALGDFNRDGKQDLVTANNGTSDVTVLMGNGAGQFGTTADQRRTFATGYSPEQIVVGDFNADGRQDMAVANRSSGTISILKDNGVGGFEKSDLSVGAISSLTLGDFNADGRQDIAFVTSNSMSIMTGNGNGTFEFKATYPSSASPLFITSGDLDGDNNLDLVVCNYGASTLTPFKGLGNGNFIKMNDFPTGSGPGCVTIGDCNGDGMPDLIVAVINNSRVAVLLNNGNFTFGAKTDYLSGAQPHFVSIADLNGDGKQDIIAANSQAGRSSGTSVSVFLGDGTGKFAAKTDYKTGGSPMSIGVGDFNGDGRQDIATPDYSSNTVSILINIEVPPLSISNLNANNLLCSSGGIFVLQGLSTGSLTSWTVAPATYFSGQTSGIGSSASVTPSSATGTGSITFTTTGLLYCQPTNYTKKFYVNAAKPTLTINGFGCNERAKNVSFTAKFDEVEGVFPIMCLKVEAGGIINGSTDPYYKCSNRVVVNARDNGNVNYKITYPSCNVNASISNLFVCSASNRMDASDEETAIDPPSVYAYAEGLLIRFQGLDNQQVQVYNSQGKYMGSSAEFFQVPQPGVYLISNEYFKTKVLVK